MKFRFISVLMIAVALAPLRSAQGQAPAGQGAVATEMRNVNYHFTDTISISIRRLEGQLVPKREGMVPVFDDKHSFFLAIQSAEIAISNDAMSHVLNDYVFARPDALIKKVSITSAEGRVKIKGTLHSKANLPFETEGTIAATPEGKIRIHATKIKAAHLPAKGIMDLIGLEISDLIKTSKVRGLRAEGDDLILDPETLLPPPAIQGRVTQVRVEGNSIVQVFGNAAAAPSLRFSDGARNYMAYRGNSLRFGKLSMADTDLELIDMDAGNPFDFYLDHYKEQLVAGYTKTTPRFGLRVYMPDYSQLRKNRRPASTKKSE